MKPFYTDTNTPQDRSFQWRACWDAAEAGFAGVTCEVSTGLRRWCGPEHIEVCRQHLAYYMHDFFPAAWSRAQSLTESFELFRDKESTQLVFDFVECQVYSKEIFRLPVYLKSSKVSDGDRSTLDAYVCCSFVWQAASSELTREDDKASNGAPSLRRPFFIVLFLIPCTVSRFRPRIAVER